jgi:hypothetical protein
VAVADGARSLAVVGTARGVGKTLTFNHLVSQAQAAGMCIGLMASGRQGEELDGAEHDDHLAVHAPRGSLVATAAEAVRRSEAYLEVLEVLPHAGPLGQLVLARVCEPGRLLLVGPPTTRALREAVGRLTALGGDLVLVDGSLDRVASAAPLVTGGTVVATGAAVGGGLREVAERTRLLLDFLRLPGVEDPRLRRAAGRAARQWRVALVHDDYRVEPLSLRTALGSAGTIAAAIEERARALVLAGALAEGVLEAMAGLRARPSGFQVVVPDGTHVFAGSRAWARFCRAGGKVAVLQSIAVRAVTLNPFGPDGLALDPDQLLGEIGRLARPLPVFDLVLGRVRNLEVAA